MIEFAVIKRFVKVYLVTEDTNYEIVPKMTNKYRLYVWEKALVDTKIKQIKFLTVKLYILNKIKDIGISATISIPYKNKGCWHIHIFFIWNYAWYSVLWVGMYVGKVGV